MRLFVAIDLDEPLRRAVADVTTRIRRQFEHAAAGARVSWTAVDRMHITLHFLGEVPDDHAATLAGAFGRPFPLRPFTLEIGAPGLFPPRGRPRVLWLGVATKGGMLGRVQDAAGERLHSLGLPVDSAPFTPHLTIGRVRSTIRPGLATAAFADAPRRVGACRVDAVTLYESRLGRSASYVALASAALSGTSLADA